MNPAEVALNTAEPRAPPLFAEDTVTFCGTFQFAVVKGSVAGAAVRSALPDARATATATVAAGWLARDTANVAVPPCRTLTVPGAAVMVGPAVTLTGTAAEVAVAPRLSVARAVSEYWPAGTFVQLPWYGAVVSVAMSCVSTKKS